MACLAFSLHLGCISAELGNSQFVCNIGSPKCPSGFECIDGICVIPGRRYDAGTEKTAIDGGAKIVDCEATALLEPGTYPGTTSGPSDLESALCGAGADSPEAYFEVRLTQESVVYLDTAGTAFDTVVSIREDDCGGSEVACNDDDACGNPTSQLVRTLVPGTWFVVVEGAAPGLQGDFQLEYAIAPCAGSSEITGPLPFSGSVEEASSLEGSCGAGPSTGEALFHFASCGQTGQWQFSTCGGGTLFDSVLYVREGSCTGTEVVLGCSDNNYCNGDHETLVLSDLARGLYFLVVDSSSVTGARSFQLDVTRPGG